MTAIPLASIEWLRAGSACLDYRRLVDDKLRIAADLYRFMMDRFHQGSAFVLELMIVIILIIDLVYLFWPRG